MILDVKVSEKVDFLLEEYAEYIDDEKKKC